MMNISNQNIELCSASGNSLVLELELVPVQSADLIHRENLDAALGNGIPHVPNVTHRH